MYYLEARNDIKCTSEGLESVENALFSKKVSKKFGRFKKSMYLCTRKSDNEELNGSVAQLNRASDYGSEGCGFDEKGIINQSLF